MLFRSPELCPELLCRNETENGRAQIVAAYALVEDEPGDGTEAPERGHDLPAVRPELIVELVLGPPVGPRHELGVHLDERVDGLRTQLL